MEVLEVGSGELDLSLIELLLPGVEDHTRRYPWSSFLAAQTLGCTAEVHRQSSF